jgi:hypothetical protein
MSKSKRTSKSTISDIKARVREGAEARKRARAKAI